VVNLDNDRFSAEKFPLKEPTRRSSGFAGSWYVINTFQSRASKMLCNYLTGMTGYVIARSIT
jgi:hypothetical protein